MIHDQIAHLAVPVTELATYPGNARQGDIGAISESLRHNGQYRPLVANRRSHQILAGNHTYKAALALGWDTVAVTWVDVDDATAAKIVLADNRANDLASNDTAALLELLGTLDGDLAGTMYDDDDVDQLVREVTGGRLPDFVPDKVTGQLDEVTVKECPSCGFQWRLGPDGEVEPAG